MAALARTGHCQKTRMMRRAASGSCKAVPAVIVPKDGPSKPDAGAGADAGAEAGAGAGAEADALGEAGTLLAEAARPALAALVPLPAGDTMEPARSRSATVFCNAVTRRATVAADLPSCSKAT